MLKLTTPSLTPPQNTQALHLTVSNLTSLQKQLSEIVRRPTN